MPVGEHEPFTIEGMLHNGKAFSGIKLQDAKIICGSAAGGCFRDIRWEFSADADRMPMEQIRRNSDMSLLDADGTVEEPARIGIIPDYMGISAWDIEALSEIGDFTPVGHVFAKCQALCFLVPIENPWVPMA